MELKQIKTLITAIARASAKLVKDIQAAATEITVHAVLHGDVTLADDLIEGVGKGVRRASLRAWFELNGPFILGDAGKFKLDSKRAKEMRKLAEADLRTLLAAKAWEDAAPEPKPVSVLDVSAAFDKFLTRLNKVANEPGVQVRDRALLDLLVNETRVWHAEQTIKASKALTPEEMKKLYGIEPKVHGEIKEGVAPAETPAEQPQS